jgi:hypothetical protein
MNDVKLYKDRLRRQLSTLVPDRAKREVFISKMEILYTRMLEQKLKHQAIALAHDKAKRVKPSKLPKDKE